MKRIQFFLLFIFTILGMLIGNDHSYYKPKSIWFGLKLGVTSSNLQGDDADDADSDPLAGVCGGVVMHKRVSDKLVLQPEVYLIRKGAIIGDDLSLKYSLIYVEMPLLIKLALFHSGDSRATIFGGPALSFLSKAEGELSWFEESEIHDIKNIFKPTDFGLIAGLSYDVEFRRRIFTIDVRYNFGITKVFSSKYESTSENDSKNGCFSLSVGLLF